MEEPWNMFRGPNGSGVFEIAQTLDNNNDTAQLVRYIITPNTYGCDNEADTALIWVEPSARVTGVPQVDTICAGDNAVVNFTSPTVPTRWMEFNIQAIADNPDSVSGYTNLNQYTTDSTLVQMLTNVSDTAQRVRYILTPYNINSPGIQYCPGRESVTTGTGGR